MWKMLSNDWCEIGKDKGVGIFQVKRQTPPFSTDPFILPATSRKGGYFVNIVWQSCICAITSIFSVFVPSWYQDPISHNRRVSGCSLKKFAGYKGNQLELNTRDKVPKLIKYLFSNLYLYLSQWAAVNSIWQLNWKGNINLTLEWNLQMADRTFGCQWPVTIGDGDDDGWSLLLHTFHWKLAWLQCWWQWRLATSPLDHWQWTDEEMGGKVERGASGSFIFRVQGVSW